jgi:hypothetical protein
MTEYPIGARPWRVLAHRRLTGQDRLTADEMERTGRSYHAGTDSLPDTDFDEVVVGQWLHVEWMDADRWWMRVGEVHIWVTVDPSGHARQVEVYGPRGRMAEPDLVWHPDLTPPEG